MFRTAFRFCPSDGTTLVQCVGEPLIGATIAGRYVLEELIGEGGMGLVYRAAHVRLPRWFAVKVLFGDMAADSRMRLRFAQEASAACQLNHPNVVTAVDFGKSDRGLVYLVMDYVEGETLSELIEREAPLSQKRVIAIGRQLAEGLSHAHGLGIVHRDFKPDNVVLEAREGDSPVPRILDFGLAISAREDVFDGRLTQHGWVVGTPVYLSPEQARDQAVDQRTDLYALGVVLYEMLAGVTPFDGDAMEMAQHNMLDPVPRIAARNPRAKVTPELEKVVRRLLEKNPEARYTTAEEVIEALDRVDQIDETQLYGVSNEMAALVLGEPLGVAEGYLPDDQPPSHRGSRLFAGVTLLAVAGAMAYLVAGGARHGGDAQVAAHTIEPEADQQTVSLADRPSAPAESTQAPALAKTETAGTPDQIETPDRTETPGTPDKMETPETPDKTEKDLKTAVTAAPATTATPSRRPSVRRPARSSPPAPARTARLVARARAPVQREPIAPPDAGIDDPDTQAQLAAVTERPAPRPAPDVSVSLLIDEYRQVGQAIAHLQESDPAVARGFRDRYFQIPYADALRIPSVRRDTLARLAALRRDLAAVSRQP